MKLKNYLLGAIAGIVIVLLVLMSLYGVKTVFFVIAEMGAVISFFALIALGVFFLFYPGKRKF